MMGFSTFARLLSLVVLLQTLPASAFLGIDLSKLKEKVENVRKGIGELGQPTTKPDSSGESDAVPNQSAEPKVISTQPSVKGLPWEKHRHWLDGRWCISAKGVTTSKIQRQFALDPTDPFNLVSAIITSERDSSSESGEREVSEVSIRSKLDLVGPDRYEITSFYIMSSDRRSRVESREVLRFRVDDDYAARRGSGFRRLYIEDWTIINPRGEDFSGLQKLSNNSNFYLTPCDSERKKVFSDAEFKTVKDSMRKYGRDQFEIKGIALFDTPPPSAADRPPVEMECVTSRTHFSGSV